MTNVDLLARSGLGQTRFESCPCHPYILVFTIHDERPSLVIEALNTERRSVLDAPDIHFSLDVT